MKVLHLIGGGDVGGAKTHVITLLSELSKTPGYTISLVSFREGDFAEDARQAGIDVHVADGSLRSDIRQVRRLAGDADILHCHGARANMVGMMIKRRLKKPIVTTVHSDYRLDYLGRPFARLTYGFINKFALRILDFRIGVSDMMTQLLITRGFRPEKIFTIYNGMDFSAKPDGKSKRELAERFGLPYEEGDIFAGMAARFDPVKDISTFIRAAALLKDDCANLRFIVAGDGKQKKILLKLAAELGVKIHFLGWLGDTLPFFRLLDINILTSLYETFPYALTEGTRMRCATVATAVGGIPLLIDHGINGLMFAPRDSAALAGALRKLRNDPALLKTMGDKLYQKAQENYSIEKMVEMQTGIYTTIMRRANRPKRKRDGITLCGAYGMDNAGDDAILEAILLEIRQQDPDIPIRVLSRNPLETRLGYRQHTFNTFNIFAFTAAVRRSCIYLSGGGNLVQDITSSRSLWFYLMTIYWAKKMGCHILMYGCGIGPISQEKNRRRTARILNENVEVITLREEGSHAELLRMGVTRPNIRITADPALILTPADDEKVDSLMLRQNLPLNGRYIAFALRNWPGFDTKVRHIAAAADYAFETYGLTPVFVPVERKQDINAARLASSMTKCSHHLLQEAGTARVAIGLMERMEVVVGMRLHSLIFAAGQGKPVVGISYNEKVRAFLEYLGQDLSVRLEDVTSQELIRYIDIAVAEIPFRDARIRAIEHLREKEKINQTVLGEMMAMNNAPS